MKTKIQNKDLKTAIDFSTLLGSIQLDGQVTLALIKNKKKLTKAHADFIEAHEAVLNARCLKDAYNQPVLTYQKDANGVEMVSLPKQYVFETPELEKATIAELKALSEVEAEVELEKISEESLKKISSITPEQMDALMLIAPLNEGE